MTPEAARDEMLAVFKTAWDVTGYAVAWTDVPSSPPSTEQPWARVTVRHGTGGQSSLATGSGGKMHTHDGTLWVQLFIPVGHGATPGYTLANTVLQAYRDARGAVWYRNHRMREVGNDGAFQQFNCLIDFSYDT